MRHTFKGGTHVPEFKDTKDIAVKRAPGPSVVKIPLSQHIGKPCEPVVSPGDHVDYGQKIGEVVGALGCPVHASVSGTVKGVELTLSATGRQVPCVVIENDGLYTQAETAKPFPRPLCEATPEQIVELVREAGISGMGGATFPTYAKLASAIGKVDTVIINCAECEPFITANHRMMLERPDRIFGGIEILLHALGLSHAIIAVEDNKMDAVAALRRLAPPEIEVAVMKTKYPQGDERQLIYALLGKELPFGKLPSDLGCIIFNAETVATVWHAFYRGIPFCKRIVTVGGDCVRHPGNYKVHIGTTYRDLIAFCGGLVKEPVRVVNGGPMMGFAQWDLDTPITKGSSALLLFSEELAKKGLNAKKTTTACIRCGRCAENCPMHLSPYRLVSAVRAGNFDKAQGEHAMSCVECGTCAYNCPAGIPLVEHIRTAKDVIRAKAPKK